MTGSIGYKPEQNKITMYTLFSFLLGMKHATEADHLVAMSLLLHPDHKPARALRMGAMWGLGHGLMLLSCGLLLSVLSARWQSTLNINLEPLVGLILIAMATLWVVRKKYPKQSSTESSSTTSNKQGYSHAFGFGLLHGLAGSVAVTLLLLSGVSSWLLATIQLGLFALGGMVSMAVMCWCYSVNIQWFRSNGQPLCSLLQNVCIGLTFIVGFGLLTS